MSWSPGCISHTETTSCPMILHVGVADWCINLPSSTSRMYLSGAMRMDSVVFVFDIRPLSLNTVECRGLLTRVNKRMVLVCRHNFTIGRILIYCNYSSLNTRLLLCVLGTN